MRLGRAHVAEFNYPQGLVNINIIIYNKNISKKISLELVQTVFVKFSIQDNKISHKISFKPLRFM